MKLALPRAAVASSVVPASLILLRTGVATAFVVPPRSSPPRVAVVGVGGASPSSPSSRWRRGDDAPLPLRMSEKQPPDEDGADLAAQFFRAVSDRNIAFDGDEIDFADAEEEEEEEEEMEEEEEGADEEAGASGYDGGENASTDLDDEDDAILREYDVSSEASLTDDQIYDEMKDRVLESAGAFVELTKGADEGSGGGLPAGAASQAYKPPTNVPDSGLTAGEVVMLVLAALRNNDVPSPDKGVEILFGYSSPGSQIAEQVASEGLTPSQYRNFLSMSEDNLALFEHTEAVINKADFSPNRLKGYFTARLMSAGGAASQKDVSVNFILSTTGTDEGDCWLIDSMLIRPSKLRRRRRR